MKNFLGTIQSILRKKKILLSRRKNLHFLLIAVQREPVPTRVLNPRTCVVQGRNPGGGYGGGAPTHKKIEKKKT